MSGRKPIPRRASPSSVPTRAETIAGRSEGSLAYQEQITGRPPGLEVKLNGVRFDGCREEDGTMLEAKGPGYADKMSGPENWKGWLTGDEKLRSK